MEHESYFIMCLLTTYLLRFKDGFAVGLTHKILVRVVISSILSSGHFGFSDPPIIISLFPV